MASPRIAEAAWYFNWSCTGQCAPGDLAVTGTEGPFDSYESCDAARWNHPMRTTVLESGNFGNVDTCYETDSPDGVSGTSSGHPRGRIVLSRAGIGIIGGGGWIDRRPGVEVTGKSTFGFELGSTWGRDGGGVELFVAMIKAEPSPSSTEPARTIVPVGFGYALSPGHAQVRFRFGGSLMIAGASSCDECGVGLGARAHAGLEVWATRAYGIAADAMLQWMSFGTYTESDIIGDSGHDLHSPTFLVRASFLLKGSTFR